MGINPNMNGNKSQRPAQPRQKSQQMPTKSASDITKKETISKSPAEVIVSYTSGIELTLGFNADMSYPLIVEKTLNSGSKIIPIVPECEPNLYAIGLEKQVQAIAKQTISSTYTPTDMTSESNIAAIKVGGAKAGVEIL